MSQDTIFSLPRFSSMPALAAAILACREPVLERWYTVVRKTLPAVDELTMDQLRDALPLVLAELAETIAHNDEVHLEGLKEVAEEHGQTRYNQDYSINDLLVEYSLLRPLLLEEVAGHLGRDLTTEEAAALNMGIDTAVRKSVTKFTAYQQQQLKIVSGAQSKYLAFLSHDLRGGLNGVLLMVEVLKRELAGEAKFSESIHDLDSMRRSILDTVSTMDRFLHAEQFRQGKVQPHNTTVPLPAFLQELISNFSYQARSKGLELICDISAKETAFTDKDMLLLILQNLLSNAIKYTVRGKVCLSLKRLDEQLQIAVADEGPGIPTERLATLFEPFIRGETHGQDGVGLGLTIAKQAADLIDAKLLVSSTLGKGTTFHLNLSTFARM